MRRLAALFAASVVWVLTIEGLAAQSDRALSLDSAIPENGDSNSHPDVPSAEPSHEAPLSQSGTWDLSAWANQAIGNSAYGNVGDVFVSMAGFRTGYVFVQPDLHSRLRGTLEYFFDVIPVFVLTKPKVIYGGGFSPIGFKWNFLASRRHPYFAMSGGGVFSTRNVPVGNTDNFNFTASVEGGMTIVSDRRHALTGNIGFFH